MSAKREWTEGGLEERGSVRGEGGHTSSAERMNGSKAHFDNVPSRFGDWIPETVESLSKHCLTHAITCTDVFLYPEQSRQLVVSFPSLPPSLSPRSASQRSRYLSTGPTLPPRLQRRPSTACQAYRPLSQRLLLPAGGMWGLTGSVGPHSPRHHSSRRLQRKLQSLSLVALVEGAWRGTMERQPRGAPASLLRPQRHLLLLRLQPLYLQPSVVAGMPARALLCRQSQTRGVEQQQAGIPSKRRRADPQLLRLYH